MLRHVARALSGLRFPSIAGIPLVVAAALVFSPLAAAPIEVEKAVLDAQAQRIAAIKKVHPAVVAVCMHGGQGGGSGVVISPDGYALTNFHVVQPTGPLMQCGLADGVLYDAVLVGLDKVGDVALIKLLPKKKGKTFPFAALGDSDKVRAATGRWRWATRSRWRSTSRRPSPTASSAACTAISRRQGRGCSSTPTASRSTRRSTPATRAGRSSTWRAS